MTSAAVRQYGAYAVTGAERKRWCRSVTTDVHVTPCGYCTQPPHSQGCSRDAAQQLQQPQQRRQQLKQHTSRATRLSAAGTNTLIGSGK